VKAREVTSFQGVSNKIEVATEQWLHEQPGFDPRFFQLISTIYMIAQQLEVDFRAVARQVGHGLGVGDLRILLVLRRSGPSYSLRATDLEDYLLITSGAVIKQIARLERKGFIARSRSTERRGRMIGLTDSGREIADHAMKLAVYPSTASAFASLEEDEQTEGVRFLRRLLGRLERSRSQSDV
jgi:DNA-binding MarR family transcriptional regulator